MLLTIEETLRQWATDNSVRAVVIRGSGEKAFSAGFDITAIPTSEDPDLTQKLLQSDPLASALRTIKQFPYPTLAMINGQCFGGALNLALCCDLRIGVSDMIIAMPPAKLGLVYPLDGLAQFASVLGTANTREMLFTGRTYDAQEARDLGLVHRLVERENLEEVSFGLAREIAANAPLALKGIKRSLNLLEACAQPDGAARQEIDQLVAESMQSADAREAQQAFIEKRKPRFSGH
jgi:enoyl-CoA hydratase/carnithine racemase